MVAWFCAARSAAGFGALLDMLASIWALEAVRVAEGRGRMKPECRLGAWQNDLQSA